MELNAEVVQSLLTCDWLKNCGQAPEEIEGVQCLFVTDKAQIEKNFKSIKWENICMYACNDVTSHLFLNHPEVYHKVWNSLVDDVEELIFPKTMGTVMKRLEELGQLTVAKGCIEMDIINMALINSYAAAGYCKSPFYERMLRIYRAGRLPCGWGGKYPKGTFQVY